MRTDGGAEVVKKFGLAITLDAVTEDEDKTASALFVPYGFMAIPITLLPEPAAAPAAGTGTADVAKLGAFWVKTLFVKSWLAFMPQPIFAAVHLLNQPYLKHLSGQRLWSQRLQCYDAIVADRSAIQTGFSEAPTVPAALKEAEEAPTLIESQEQEPAAEQDGSGAEDAIQRDMDNIFAAPTEEEKAAAQPPKKKLKASPKAAGSGRLGIAQAKATARSSGAAASSG